MGLADDRRDVVFAVGDEFDIFHDDNVVKVLDILEGFGEFIGRVHGVAGEEFFVSADDAGGGFNQAGRGCGQSWFIPLRHRSVGTRG